MKKLVLCMSFVLSGCASAPAYYNKSGVASDLLSTIETNGGSYTFNEIKALVSAVYDGSGNRVVGTDSFVEQNRWYQLHLEPGVYTVTVFCNDGFVYSYPQIRLELEKSKKYTLGCEIKGHKYFDAKNENVMIVKVLGVNNK